MHTTHLFEGLLFALLETVKQGDIIDRECDVHCLFSTDGQLCFAPKQAYLSN